MSDDKNTMMDLKKFLGTEENPVSNTEMAEFWKSLTDEEKEEFKNTELPKDK